MSNSKLIPPWRIKDDGKVIIRTFGPISMKAPSGKKLWGDGPYILFQCKLPKEIFPDGKVDPEILFLAWKKLNHDLIWGKGKNEFDT